MRELFRTSIDLHKVAASMSDEKKDEIANSLWNYTLDRYVEQLRQKYRPDLIEAIVAPMRKSRPTLQTLLNTLTPEAKEKLAAEMQKETL